MGDNPGGASHCRAPLGTQRQTHFRQPFPSTKSTFLTVAQCVCQEYLQYALCTKLPISVYGNLKQGGNNHSALPISAMHGSVEALSDLV